LCSQCIINAPPADSVAPNPASAKLWSAKAKENIDNDITVNIK